MPGEIINSNYEENDATTFLSEINVDCLKGRVCYFSLTGDLALKSFEEIKFSTYRNKNTRRKKLKEALSERLNFALLMFDKVILHCSDPLRSEIVLEVLEEKIEWIKNGRIGFVFSNHIKNINKDYKNYILEKTKEYEEGFYSQNEAESLTQTHITDEYYERVICLLNSTTCLIRKSEEYSFDKLVLNDLTSILNTEQVIIDSSADLPLILSLNLSLYQLLHIKIMPKEQRREFIDDGYIFPKSDIEDVSNQVQEYLEQGNTIARSAIVDFLGEALENKMNKLQRNVLKAITLRMDILYCQLNSGKQLILEFHPSYESRSIYQYNCFEKYIQLIADTDKKVVLRFDTIDKILENNNLVDFRLIFLSCMADTREHMNFIQVSSNLYQDRYFNLFSAVFHNHQFSDSFKTIKDLLQENDSNGSF